VVVDESGKTSELAQTTTPEPAPTPTPAPAVEPEPVQTAAAQAPAPVAEPVQQELPHTASAMPLLGLIGLLSAGAFVALRIRSKRMS
jgi:LPXTG-motif cell wall-anchored protein